MHLVSQKPSNSGWKCSIFWCWKSFGNVCCRLCKNDKQFVFNCFFSFLFYIFICVCSSTPFFLFALALVFCFIEIISNTKSMRGNWHLDSNLFFFTYIYITISSTALFLRTKSLSNDFQICPKCGKCACNIQRLSLKQIWKIDWNTFVETCEDNSYRAHNAILVNGIKCYETMRDNIMIWYSHCQPLISRGTFECTWGMSMGEPVRHVSRWSQHHI